MQKKWKQLLVCLAVPLSAGGLSAWLSRKGMKAFGTLRKPPLSPPAWLFPVVWTILFLLMGLASWLVLRQQRRLRAALPVYGVQLFFNFFWSLLFFQWGLFLPALFCWRRCGTDRLDRYAVPPAAGWLLAPYLLWVSFTAYLNAGIWLLN